MEDDDGGWQWRMAKNILLYISLQAREVTYSCSGSPVTGMHQPGTNALHQDHKVFLFITPSTGDGLQLIDALLSRWVACYQICPKGHSGSSSY